MIKKDFYEWLKISPDNIDNFFKYIPEAANSAKDRKSFGCMMFYFKLPGWYEYLLEFDKKDIYDNKDYDYGLEIEPHTTLMFGLHLDEVKQEDVIKWFEGVKKFKGKLTDITMFENDDAEYDVVKFDVKAKKLDEFRKEVEKKFENTQTFDEFHPHATLAYVKKGTGKKYTKKLKDVNVEFKYGVYSVQNYEKTFITLK